jgi:hypothetical protein
MREKSSGQLDETSAANGPGAVHAYEPPRIERLGSLRDLAGKSFDKIGAKNDPGSHVDDRT